MISKRRVWLTGMGVCVVGLTLNPASAQCRYTWTEIPPLQLPSGQRLYPAPTGMNNVGQVVGYFQSIGGETETGFVWSEAEGLNLMPRPAGYSIVRPLDINDLGQVVGWADDATHHFAFLWDGGSTYRDLGYPPNGNHAEAEAINNFGQIVGTWGNIVTGPLHAFLWESGVGTDLGAAVGTECSQAHDINDNGQITGARWTGTNPKRAYRLDSTGVAALEPEAGCDETVGWGINEDGVVCASEGCGPPGQSRYSHGIAWNGVEVRIIRSVAADRFVVPRDIDERMCVVGYNRNNTSANGFLWENGVTIPLAALIDNPPPNTTMFLGMALNSAGQIACKINFGALLLTPAVHRGDTNGDCRVDIHDLVIVLSSFGCDGGACDGDLNGDGVVALSDLAIVLSSFGH